MSSEMYEYTLQICVPTYQRIDHLKELLNSIEAFLANTGLSLCVVVVDNCSTDGTYAYLKNVQFRFSYPMYVACNDENIGGIRNIRKCSVNQYGKYTLIVGDDDMFTAHSSQLLQQALALMDTLEISACVAHARLPSIINDFQWLCYAPLAYPAFLPSTLYRTMPWIEYNYDEYPLKLPQLHFILNMFCLHKAAAIRGQYVLKGDDINTGSKGYWFYTNNIIVDLVEKPLLLQNVLKSKPPLSIQQKLRLKASTVKHQSLKLKHLFLNPEQMFVVYVEIRNYASISSDNAQNLLFLKLVLVLIIKLQSYGKILHRLYGRVWN